MKRVTITLPNIPRQPNLWSLPWSTTQAFSSFLKGAFLFLKVTPVCDHQSKIKAIYWLEYISTGKKWSHTMKTLTSNSSLDPGCCVRAAMPSKSWSKWDTTECFACHLQDLTARGLILVVLCSKGHSTVLPFTVLIRSSTFLQCLAIGDMSLSSWLMSRVWLWLWQDRVGRKQSLVSLWFTSVLSATKRSPQSAIVVL